MFTEFSFIICQYFKWLFYNQNLKSLKRKQLLSVDQMRKPCISSNVFSLHKLYFAIITYFIFIEYNQFS